MNALSFCYSCCRLVGDTTTGEVQPRGRLRPSRGMMRQGRRVKKRRQVFELCCSTELKIGRFSAPSGLERGSDQQVLSECKRQNEVEAALRRVVCTETIGLLS